MTISLWAAPVELFVTAADSNDDDFWLESRFGQTNNPIISDAETPAATYSANQPNDYAMYVQAENWDGDLQAPLNIGSTGAVSLPFAPFSALLAQNSSPTEGLDLAIWWEPSSTASGAYDIEFQNLSDNLIDIDTTNPALQTIGAPATLVSGVVDPLGWDYVANGTDLVYSYGTADGASAKTITLQIFIPEGAAVSAPAQAAVDVPLSTIYRIAYFSSLSSFEYVQSATVDGAQGFDFSTINTTTGALGTPTFEAVPLGGGETGADPIVIDSVAFSPLKNGDILEFVGYRDTAGEPYWQGVKTQLLNSSFDNISSSTDDFTSGGFENIGQSTLAHWAAATLANGDTILIYALNQVITIEQFDANGNVAESFGFSPQDSSGSEFSPTDFDSIVAMGSRFEVTYRRTVTTVNGTSSRVYAVIYDTATKGESFTIDDSTNVDGLWAGTPFDDTVTYGPGVNEINGGGGTDTFVASPLLSNQVSISIDAKDQVVFAVNAAAVDTLERFSYIDLADATIAISGDTLNETFLNGDRQVTTYTAIGELFSTRTFGADGQLTDVTYATQIPNDFTERGHSDILFQSETGALLTWQIGATLAGGGTIGDRGPDWTYEGAGDFNGDGYSDALWGNGSGKLWISEIAGTSIVGGGAIGKPGGTWRVVGTGDFYGDGFSDILFEDARRDLSVWEMDGTSIVGGGALGKLGVGWALLGLGDFNDDGKSDLLFENASGEYATWLLDGTSIIGGATLGSPGADWVYKGIGNFNGLGDSDILFENTTTGVYATWDIADDKIVGGGSIGAPGSSWTLAAIGDYTENGHSDLLFRNVLTRQYATWDLDDTSIIGGGPIGNPGLDYAPAPGAPAAAPEPAPILVFENSAGALATWEIENGAISGGGVLGAPGAGWTALAVGDLYGDGQSDVLFENTSGVYAVWRTNGSSIVGGGDIGSAPGWTFKGLGDFNGDGTSDALFENGAGGYATWALNRTSIIGGANLGTPGAGFTYAGTGDFTGDGTSDILFADSSGNYWIQFVNNDAVVTTAEIGNPGAGWTLKGVGDLNGDGKADLLFENASGAYASWDMSGSTIVGGGTIGNPGSQWAYEGIGVFNSGDHASLVFENTSSGQVATWLMSNSTILGGSTLGTAAGYGIIGVR